MATFERVNPMKRHLIRTTWIAAALCLGMAVLGFGQKTETGTDMANRTNEGNTANTAKSSLSSADKHFVRNAAEGGLAEIELGKLTQEKASSSEMKDFASKMVEDHSRTNE